MVSYFECYNFNEEWLLVEMILNIPTSEIDWDSMVVSDDTLDKGEWQCAYMEQFLNADGTEKLCEVYDEPKDDVNPSRVAFFIFREGSRVLRTVYGDFDLSNVKNLPNRLKSIIEFQED